MAANRLKLAVPAFFLSAGAAFGSPQNKGVALDDLLTAEAMPLKMLVAKAKVVDVKSSDRLEAERIAAAPKEKKPEPAAISVEAWIRKGTQTIAQLVSMPVAPKESKSNETKVATVTIGATTNQKPVASLDGVRIPAAASLSPVAALTIEVSESKEGLSFKPQRLVFPNPKAVVRMKLGPSTLKGISIFVRDQSVAVLDRSTMELRAKKAGSTEIYAVFAGKMYIVPMVVEDKSNNGELKVPDALLSLDGVFNGSQGSAIFSGLEQATKAPASGSREEDGPSFQDSLAETERSAREVEDDSHHYTLEKGGQAYGPITIQVIDDRSVPSEGRIYPVAGASVKIVGTDYVGRTDSTGHLTIRDMPANGRFLLALNDTGGIIHPGIAEVSSRTSLDGPVVRVKVMRTFSYDGYASLAGVGQDERYGSICSTVIGQNAGKNGPLEGIGVSTDTQADGPYFFNKFGFLDRSMRTTGPNGRFCYYNVAPGPMTLGFYEDGAIVASMPIASFPGRHLEQDFSVENKFSVSARLSAMGTAYDQLGSDPAAAHGLKTIDMIDLIPLGQSDPMMQIAPGRVQTSSALVSTSGRVMAYAQAAEFEPAVYSFDTSRRDRVVPLIPRGFIEDMSVYAQVAFNPDLGSVLVEYGHLDGDSVVAMRLVDAEGRDVGEGWYFSDQPVTKALFFNVPAGAYQVLVETKDGFWLAADTTVVYNETVSFLRMGGQVQYRN